MADLVDDANSGTPIANPDEFDEFPIRARRALKEARSRVTPRLSAMLVWERVFSDGERARLGGDWRLAWETGGTIGMWMRLRGVSRMRAILDIAAALELMSATTHRWLLREIGDSLEDTDADEAIEQAIKRSALVLIERPRAASWRGMAIEIPWEECHALWQYLWMLAERAKAGGTVDDMVFPEGRKPGYAAKTKSRLVNHPSFPGGLADLIVSAGRGSQKLDLPPEEIRLFFVKALEKLRENLA